MTTDGFPSGTVQDHDFDELIQNSLSEFLAKHNMSADKVKLDSSVGKPTPKLAVKASWEIAEDVFRQIGPDFPVWQPANENQLKFDIAHGYLGECL